MSAIYSKRQTLFSKQATEWRVEDDALVMREPGIAEQKFPWRDVSSVRLAYAPTRLKTWRYTFVIYFKTGQTLEIDNAHFAGVGDFEDYSETYVPFVHAALARIQVHAPQARARAGSGALSYVLNLLFVVTAFTALAIVLVVMPTPLDYLSFSSFLKLGIIIFFIPFLIRWARKARPRSMSLSEIPNDALPRLAGA